MRFSVLTCYVSFFFHMIIFWFVCLIWRYGYCLIRWQVQKICKQTRDSSYFRLIYGVFFVRQRPSVPPSVRLSSWPFVELVSPEICQPANSNDKQWTNLSNIGSYIPFVYLFMYCTHVCVRVRVCVCIFLLFKFQFYCFVSYRAYLFFVPFRAAAKFHAR